MIAHFVEHTGFTTVDEDGPKTCVSAYYGGVWVYLRVFPIARTILDILAPILAEKERDNRQLKLEIAEQEETSRISIYGWRDKANEMEAALAAERAQADHFRDRAIVDRAASEPVFWKSRALAAEAALAAERERCAAVAERDHESFDYDKALAECRDYDCGYANGRQDAAAAIRVQGE